MAAQNKEKAFAWVTGANGLIGNYFVQSSAHAAPDWQVVGLKREHFDLTDFGAVERAFQDQKPRLIIHCAALSKSPACQANPGLANRINVEATRHLENLAADVQFVFFSTDLVFDGKQGNYNEFATVNPLSVYGETKAKAEQIVLANPCHLVIRTSLNGGTSPTHDRGFNEEMRKAWEAGKELKLFTDEFRCPIPAVETVRAVWELVYQRRAGLFHVAGSERLSRWEIGQLLARRWPQLSPKMVPGSTKDYQGAPRPPDTSLNCSKAQQFLSYPLPALTQWLKEHPEVEF